MMQGNFAEISDKSANLPQNFLYKSPKSRIPQPSVADAAEIETDLKILFPRGCNPAAMMIQ